METRKIKIKVNNPGMYHYLVEGDYIWEFDNYKKEEKDKEFDYFLWYIRELIGVQDEYEMINSLDLELERYVRNHVRNLEIVDVTVLATPAKRPLYFIKRHLHRAWNLYFEGKKNLAFEICSKMRTRLEEEFGIYPIDEEFYYQYICE